MVLLREVLAIHGLSLRPVHLVDADRTVRWVAASELDDPTPFLEGGELLLTTGLDMDGWSDEQWISYVTSLVELPVASLGFGTGLTHGDVPTALVAAARIAGLNLVEVPRQTPFVAVSRQTAELVEREQERESSDVLLAQKALSQAALAPDRGARVVERLARQVRGGAAIVSPDGRVVEGPFGSFDEVALEAVREQLPGLRAGGLRGTAGWQVGGALFSVQPLGVRGRPESFLAVSLPAPWDRLRRSVVTTAGALLSLRAEGELEARRSRRRLRHNALELLLRGEVGSSTLVLDAGGEPPLPAQLQVALLEGDEGAIAESQVALEDAGVWSAPSGSSVVAVIRPAQLQLVAKVVRRTGVSAAAGMVVDRDDAARSHRTASAVLSQGGGPGLRTWRDVLQRGVLGVLDAEAADNYAEATLSGLSAEDRDFLRTFLQHHGSRSAVATAYSMHRNTVRHRLDVLEGALRGSLDDPQLRADLWIALAAEASSTRSVSR